MRARSPATARAGPGPAAAAAPPGRARWPARSWRLPPACRRGPRTRARRRAPRSSAAAFGGLGRRRGATPRPRPACRPWRPTDPAEAEPGFGHRRIEAQRLPERAAADVELLAFRPDVRAHRGAAERPGELLEQRRRQPLVLAALRGTAARRRRGSPAAHGGDGWNRTTRRAARARWWPGTSPAPTCRPARGRVQVLHQQPPEIPVEAHRFGAFRAAVSDQHHHRRGHRHRFAIGRDQVGGQRRDVGVHERGPLEDVGHRSRRGRRAASASSVVRAAPCGCDGHRRLGRRGLSAAGRGSGYRAAAPPRAAAPGRRSTAGADRRGSSAWPRAARCRARRAGAARRSTTSARAARAASPRASPVRPAGRPQRPSAAGPAATRRSPTCAGAASWADSTCASAAGRATGWRLADHASRAVTLPGCVGASELLDCPVPIRARMTSCGPSR